MTDAIAIDVWSDIACPWCYIGKRNLEKAIASRGEGVPDVRVTFHSFELAPETPVDFDGGEAEYLAAHKGVDAASAQQMLDRVSGVAADAGLEYRFDLLRHTNTVKAHQLLHLAKERGRQHEMSERGLPRGGSSGSGAGERLRHHRGALLRHRRCLRRQRRTAAGGLRTDPEADRERADGGGRRRSGLRTRGSPSGGQMLLDQAQDLRVVG